MDAGPRRREPMAQLPRARAAAGRLREPNGLHSRRAHAGDGAPAVRDVGLPGHRLLRADEPLRNAARLHAPSRLSASKRLSSQPLLVPILLSIRPLYPPPVRLASPLRACGSAA